MTSRRRHHDPQVYLLHLGDHVTVTLVIAVTQVPRLRETFILSPSCRA